MFCGVVFGDLWVISSAKPLILGFYEKDSCASVAFGGARDGSMEGRGLLRRRRGFLEAAEGA